MALSGIFYGKTTNQFVKPRIRWSAQQNILENYSDVTVELTYSRTNTGYTTGGYWSGSLYVDKGLDLEQKATVSSKYLEVTYQSQTLAISHTFRVYHDDLGRKKLTLSATGSISGSSVTSTTISQEVELDTIARASTIGATDANIGAASMVVVTRKDPSFTHSIAYAFGELAGFLHPDGSTGSEEVVFSQTAVSFLVPDAFYDQIPDARSGKCSLICRTYADGVQIGQAQSTSFTAFAPEQSCAPAIQASVVDGNDATKALTGDENVLIRYHSSAQCTVNAEAKNAASLTAVCVNGAALDGGRVSIPYVETGSFAFTAQDSRGFTKTLQVEKTLVPYIRLTAHGTIKRTDPTSGNAVLALEGNFYAGSFGAADNALRLTYRVGSGEEVGIMAEVSGDTYRASAQISGLDYDASHEVILTAQDKLEQVITVLQVKKGIPTFDWGEQDFRFHVPVSVDGKPISDLPMPVNPGDAACKQYVDNSFPGLATQMTPGLMSAADKKKLDTLEGGTGGDSAGTTLLWANSDPTSNYEPGKQEIDLSSYTAILVWYRLVTTANNMVGFAVPVGVGSVTDSGDMHNATACQASGDNRWLRRYCYASADGVTFSQGEYRTSVSGDYSTNNKYLIPMYVYGIGGGTDEVITEEEIDSLTANLK